jgi:hypothetical protein
MNNILILKRPNPSSISELTDDELEKLREGHENLEIIV